MPLATVEIRGTHKTWGPTFNVSTKEIARMRDDGLDVLTLENSIPTWAPPRLWCFLQDIWNLRL